MKGSAASARPPPRNERSRTRPCERLRDVGYERGGTLAYLAAWDVHHANLFDRVEQSTGIEEPFGAGGWSR